MRRLGKWIWVISGITLGSIALLAGLFVLALLLIKLVWAWAMPDLLPGAVDQGLVAKSLSWYAAFKLAFSSRCWEQWPGAAKEGTRRRVPGPYRSQW